MVNATEQLSLTFSAIADPTRRSILSELSKGERTVSQLAAPFEVTMPAITKHLKVLERAGLIERGQKAQWRPCRLKAQPLQEASEWIEIYRAFWESSFAKLDDCLHEMQSTARTKSKRDS